MKRLTLPIVSALLLGGAAAHPFQDLKPKVEAGQKLRTTISITSTLELAESRMLQDGEEMPSDMMPQMERSNSDTTDLVVLDTIRAAEDGRASAFSREYETLAGDVSFEMSMEGDGMEGHDMSHEDELESELEGDVVDFQLEGEAFVAAPGEGSSLSEEQVAGLEADLTLAFLLPEDEAAEGDSWDVPIELAEQLLKPGGDLLLVSSEEDPHDGLPGLADGDEDDDEPEDLEGALTVTHKGTREVDGKELVVLALELEMESLFSPDPESMFAVEGDGEGMMVPEVVSMEVVHRMEGEGELLWDPAAGRLHSLDLTLEVEQTSETVMELDIPCMGVIELEQGETEEGTTRIQIACEEG